jgi:ectoine hydroxylase-related dioxygenase (phytanoyl-CoA dioxygenase family)
MIHTTVTYGLPAKYRLNVAVHEAGDRDFDDSSLNARDRYADFGYLVVKDLIPASLCDAVVEAFRQEIKPYNGLLLRQASARFSHHLFTHDGFMANALLSVQDLISPGFTRFRANAVDVLANQAAQKVVAEIIGRPQLIESMFFESTLIGTPLHADGDYMDSTTSGMMVAAWFALEDISPLAGRFVLAPRSHRLLQEASLAGELYRKFRSQQALTSATIASDDKENLKRRLEEGAMLHQALIKAAAPVIAPLLNKGDAIFWHSDLIHGSLPPGAPALSRNSLTAHYIPEACALMTYGRRVEFQTEIHNGMKLRIMREAREAQ